MTPGAVGSLVTECVLPKNHLRKLPELDTIDRCKDFSFLGEEYRWHGAMVFYDIELIFLKYLCRQFYNYWRERYGRICVFTVG